MVSLSLDGVITSLLISTIGKHLYVLLLTHGLLVNFLKESIKFTTCRNESEVSVGGGRRYVKFPNSYTSGRKTLKRVTLTINITPTQDRDSVT